jgi:hypothetical protein
MQRFVTIVAGVLCLAAGPASAATLTSPVESTGPFGTDAPGLGVVNLPLFDSTLGTLTAVSVSETGTFSGGANLINNGHMPDSFTFNIGGQAGVDILSGDPSSAAADLRAYDFDTSMPSQFYSLARSAVGAYGPYVVDWGSTAITGLPVADFQAAGGGSVAITFDATSFPVDSPGVIELNDVFYSEQGLQATANLQVTYTYTPTGGGGGVNGGVPEPATWAMMLIGMAGAGGGLRNGRRRAVGAGPDPAKSGLFF